LLLIGGFKIVEGTLLLAIALGALRLIHHDSAAILLHWIAFLRVDPANIFIHRLLDKVELLNDHKLREFSIGTFIYAGLRLTEGFGLAYRQRWAEYFTILLTSSFIPLELFELHRHVSVPKLIVLLLNVAIVPYLIYELRRGKSSSK